VSVRVILKKYGLIPDKDAKILSISGGSSLRLAALSFRLMNGSPPSRRKILLVCRYKDCLQLTYKGRVQLEKPRDDLFQFFAWKWIY
jgi:hypothetical protein